MNIKHSIGLNLSADAIPGRLHMVQGDANSRTIVATLWDGAQLYSIPAGAVIMVRFRKPDGTGGLYDATESGSEVSYAGSIVTAPVATQMLVVAGDVFAEIDIFGSSSGAAAERLATFRFVVEVAPCVLPDAEIISSDYYNILAADIADAKAAADLAKDYAASAKQSADSAAASVEGAVKYNAPQTLTDAQKQQARDNINASAPYTAGENISISGSVIATKAFPCNPNLLDNWYFGNPVDQRRGRIVPAGTPYFVPGSSTQSGVLSSPATVIGYLNSGGLYPQVKVGSETYITQIGTDVSGYVGAGYGIDRWKSNNEDVVALVSNGEIQVVLNGQNWGGIEQIMEFPQIYAGRTVSLSALGYTTGVGHSLHLQYGDNTTIVQGTFPQGAVGLLHLNCTIPLGVDEKFRVRTVRDGSVAGDSTLHLLAVGLELGTEQTLAHQENGVWVLNEIPKYGDQLAECQRYYRPLFKPNMDYAVPATATTEGVLHLDYALNPTMRTTPALVGDTHGALRIVAYNMNDLSVAIAEPCDYIALVTNGSSVDRTTLKIVPNSGVSLVGKYCFTVDTFGISTELGLSADL